MEYSRLVEHLRTGNLVAVIGAGTSLPYLDSDSGKQFPGLLSAATLVDQLAGQRSYIQKGMPFHQACFLYKTAESRGDLEAFITKHLDKRGLKPPPAQQLLASLPFAGYITTNVDTLLEDALREINRRPHPIIEDKDIPLLRPGEVPVIKVHGCISRPQTMILAADEYAPLEKRFPIIDALLKVNLAQKTALFLGYSLTDYDFIQLIAMLQTELANYMPSGSAVVAAATNYEQQFWKANRIEIVATDLTQFLRELAKNSAESAIPAVYHPGEDWIGNAYFVSLQNIRTLPSETQVIDAFLDGLLSDLQSPGFDLPQILSRADLARTAVLSDRQNFGAFERIASETIFLINGSASTAEGETHLKDLRAERSTIGHKFEKKGRTLVDLNDSILIYSQSIRVIQVLTGAPRNKQSSSQIFIAECRPKSPSSFRDALSFARNLMDTEYEMTVIPDVAVGHLIQARQVTKIFIGAHNIFSENGVWRSFVNTCGSYLITQVAAAHNIPVFVIADVLKITDLAPGAHKPLVSTTQEEPLFDSISPQLGDLASRGKVLKTLNLGYDLCPVLPNMTLVTEN